MGSILFSKERRYKRNTMLFLIIKPAGRASRNGSAPRLARAIAVPLVPDFIGKSEKDRVFSTKRYSPLCQVPRERVMPIAARCRCGRAIRVKDELAGRRIRCPECSEVLRVPVPEAEIAEEDSEDREGKLGDKDPGNQRPMRWDLLPGSRKQGHGRCRTGRRG
jgi:hypothetical protein